MRTAVTILAVLGFFVVLTRVLRGVLDVLRWAVDAFLARETASTHAHRGDLTKMRSADERAAAARRRRWRALGWGAVWVVLLAAPPLTAWTREIYASYSVVWLVWRGRKR